MRSRFLLGAGIAAIVAVFAATALWSTSPNYRVLFANVSDKDGGAIIAALAQMNIPYKHAEGGSAILVPADKVHDARLKLASQGLPKGGNVGLELVETQRFGATQFQEHVSYQRGLEGELARSIQSLAAVQTARVHLALPKQSVFLREQQKPSASVLLTLHTGHTLDRGQIAGIVHLVAASIPDLALKNVSVLDQSGALLSQPQDNSASGTLDAKQISYVREIEVQHARRIVDLIEPIVGRDGVRAQVTADVDFSEIESTAETYAPNQGTDAKASIRSQSNSDAGNGGSGSAGGVPGALSNSPAPAPSAPLSGGSGSPGASGGAGSKRESTVNYELDRTVRRVRNQTGVVKRLTAAVVINHKKVVEEGGKIGAKPLTEAEMGQVQSLVREAIGYNKERGDSINVVNAPFTQEPVPAASNPAWWQNATWLAIGSEAGKALTFLMALMFIIFGVVRPILKQFAATRESAAASIPSGAPGIEYTAEGAAQLPGPATPAASPAARIESVRELAKNDPAAVANVVKQWVGSNG